MAKSRKRAVTKRRKTRTVKRRLPAAFEYIDRALLPPSFKGPCNMPRVCRYLEQLYDWTKKMEAYTKSHALAICNLEKQVFVGSGAQTTRPPRLCLGGGGSEPADPPKPPDW